MRAGPEGPLVQAARDWSQWPMVSEQSIPSPRQSVAVRTSGLGLCRPLITRYWGGSSAASTCRDHHPLPVDRPEEVGVANRRFLDEIDLAAEQVSQLGEQTEIAPGRLPL